MAKKTPTVRASRGGEAWDTPYGPGGGRGTVRGGWMREPEPELPKNIGEYTVEELREMHKTMLLQDALLERLTKAGIEYTRVVDIDGDKLVLGGKPIKVEKPDFPVKMGDWVVISEETKQITEASKRPIGGEVATISRVVDEHWVEVGGLMGSRLVRRQPGEKVTEGEEWVIASEINILIRKIERPVKKTAQDYAPVLWHDIGGLVNVKQELRESIALLKGGDRLSKSLGISQPKGLLFYGPPGNGKTMLGRAVATELSGEAKMAFIYVKGPEILSKFVGVAEERVRNLFVEARRHHATTGVPAVIFIDECDAVMNTRGSGRSSDVERTIVPAFLTEMDGLETSHAFIILATNRPDTLDPAIIREGRIDRHIEVGRPDIDSIKSILTSLTKKVPCMVTLAKEMDGIASALMGHKDLSGAHVAAVVERAKRQALRRGQAAGQSSVMLSPDDFARVM